MHCCGEDRLRNRRARAAWGYSYTRMYCSYVAGHCLLLSCCVVPAAQHLGRNSAFAPQVPEGLFFEALFRREACFSRERRRHFFTPAVRRRIKTFFRRLYALLSCEIRACRSAHVLHFLGSGGPSGGLPREASAPAAGVARNTPPARAALRLTRFSGYYMFCASRKGSVGNGQVTEASQE